MSGKAGGWALFLAVILLLSFAAVTPYSGMADHAMVAARLLLVVLLSVLVIRERWQHRYDHARKDPAVGSDRGETLLGRMRLWYYGQENSTIRQPEEPPKASRR